MNLFLAALITRFSCIWLASSSKGFLHLLLLCSSNLPFYNFNPLTLRCWDGKKKKKTHWACVQSLAAVCRLTGSGQSQPALCFCVFFQGFDVSAVPTQCVCLFVCAFVFAVGQLSVVVLASHPHTFSRIYTNADTHTQTHGPL